MKRTKLVPRIKKQIGGSCYAYALSVLFEYKLKKEYDIDVELDAYDFHKRFLNWMDGRVQKLNKALEFAKREGFKAKNSNRVYKLRSFKRILDPNIWDWIKDEPLVITIDLERGETLLQRLDKNYIMKRRIGGYHAIVGMEIVDLVYMSCANSNGETWGDNGYFYFPRTQAKIIKEGYKIMV